MRWTRCSIVGANRGCARLLGRRCAPGGRVRGQCCTALMDTRRGPCRPLAPPVLPLGLPRRLPRAGFDLAHSLRQLAGVPASKWRSFSLQHAAHNLFFAKFDMSSFTARGAGKGTPLSRPTRTSDSRGCGSVGTLNWQRGAGKAKPLVFERFCPSTLPEAGQTMELSAL